MKASLAHINRDIITWAMQLRGITREQLAVPNMITAEQVKAWEDGNSLPTHNQAEKLAEKLGIPFLVLFLSQRPDISVNMPDLRTVSGAPVTNASLEFLQVINDALVRQDWYRDFQRSKATEPLSFVGKYTINSDVAQMAAEIAEYLELDVLRLQSQSWREFLDSFIAAVESIGVPVFRSALVAHNTRKKLKVGEFRGFVMSDPIAPVIFVNDDDAKAAQIFTLAHELAHIWIGESGISDPNLKQRSDQLKNKIERFCNRVAAEMLVPSADFVQQWQAGLSVRNNITRLTSQYRVSSLVILIRAYELGKLPYTQFQSFFDAEEKRFRLQDKKEKRVEADRLKKKQGGNFWASFSIRNSRGFTHMVITAVRSGYSRYTDAASLLGVKAATLERYFKRFVQSA